MPTISLWRAVKATIENAVIEACGLLAEGEPAVLLVAYDCPLPTPYSAFQDCDEQPFAWAWLMRPAADEVVSLTWSDASEHSASKFRALASGIRGPAFLST